MVPRFSHDVVSARPASSTVPKNARMAEEFHMTRHGACAKQLFTKMAESNEQHQLAHKKEKHSEKTNLDTTKTRKNRGVVWQDDATNFLIDVWSEELIQLQLDLENCKKSKQMSKIMRRISTANVNR